MDETDRLVITYSGCPAEGCMPPANAWTIPPEPTEAYPKSHVYYAALTPCSVDPATGKGATGHAWFTFEEDAGTL